MPAPLLLGQSFYTMRERLRGYLPQRRCNGWETQHVELDVTLCWAPWLAWIVDGWTGRQLAIALDPTSLGDRFVVLTISVVYRACAVPVAWKVLEANEK
jgi:hypothetical protein